MSVGQPASGLCKCQLVTTCASQKADVKAAGEAERVHGDHPGAARTQPSSGHTLLPWPLARELKDMKSDTGHQDRSDVKTEATQDSAISCQTLPWGPLHLGVSTGHTASFIRFSPKDLHPLDPGPHGNGASCLLRLVPRSCREGKCSAERAALWSSISLGFQMTTTLIKLGWKKTRWIRF